MEVKKNMSIISRNKNQEIAFQIMYSFLIYQKLNLEIDVEKQIENIYGEKYSDIDIFVREILIKGLLHKDFCINLLEQYLKDWKFSRLNYCVQAILLLATTNYFFLKNTEKAIIINVAVHLTKKYGDKQDFKFLNAVLDRCLDDSNKQQ